MSTNTTNTPTTTYTPSHTPGVLYTTLHIYYQTHIFRAKTQSSGICGQMEVFFCCCWSACTPLRYRACLIGHVLHKHPHKGPMKQFLSLFVLFATFMPSTLVYILCCCDSAWAVFCCHATQQWQLPYQMRKNDRLVCVLPPPRPERPPTDLDTPLACHTQHYSHLTKHTLFVPKHNLRAFAARLKSCFVVAGLHALPWGTGRV